MKIEHLEECVHLARTLNFTQTARHFGLAQPALSKHISDLEKDLGMQIFARDTHHVRLTKFGHTIIEDIANTVGAYSAMCDHARRIQNSVNQSLTIAYLQGTAGKLIPSINDEFMERYPDTELSYRVHTWPEILNMYTSGGADIAICGGTSDMLDRKFDRSLLFVDRFCAIVPPKHPLSGRSSLTVQDLIGHKIYIPSEAFLPEDTKSISEYLYEHSSEMEISAKILDFESVPMLLRLGNAVNISASTVRYLYNDSDLQYIPLTDCPLDFRIYIYWRVDSLNDTTKAYIDIVKKHFREKLGEFAYD